MRAAALAFAAAAAIISGCQPGQGIRGYWSSRTISLEDVTAAEDQFADFALLAAGAPQQEAFAAVDMLLKKAAEDEVAFYVYSEWIIRGFSTLDSPCRSCPIFVHAADKILGKGILNDFEAEEYSRRREFCLHNQAGQKAELPEVVGSASLPSGSRTLFLVIDQDCPACKEAMQKFRSTKWVGTTRIALCYGRGQLPEEEGWLCCRISPQQDILDVRQAPFFFVISPSGTVELSYTSVNQEIAL